MNRIVVAAVGLLALTNLVVLTGVAYNRSGEPVSSIELTERELTQPQTYMSVDENSGTSLNLDWQLLDSGDEPDFLYTRYVTPAWLNHAKLTELGFDLEKINRDYSKATYEPDIHSADVILVLEYDGDAYKQALQLAENTVARLRAEVKQNPDAFEPGRDLARYETELKQVKVSQSRLYVIDAGLDMSSLQLKYSDKNKYLLARGEIGVDWQEKNIQGRVRHLYIPAIHVPLPYSQQLNRITKNEAYFVHDKDPVPPRYSVQLNMGKRFEPWIASIAPLSPAK